MLLYLVRHGETDCNNKKIIQGQSIPSRLTAAGRHQAELAGRRTARYGITHVYTSDLLRAEETANIICTAAELVPVKEPLLRERCFGELEGKTKEEIERLFPLDKCSWRKTFAAAPPQGESLLDVTKRAAIFTERLQREHSDSDTVMAVTHGGTLRALVLVLLGLEPDIWKRLSFDNTSITLFELKNGTAYLKYLNDAAHLETETMAEDADNSVQ